MSKIITICGSSKFVDIMAVCAWILERDEKAIVMSLHLLPNWYPNCPEDHLAEHEGLADEMDNLHLGKIDISSEIFVVDFGKYIGESTAREIKHAEERRIPIRYYSADPIGCLVDNIIIDHFRNEKKKGNES